MIIFDSNVFVESIIAMNNNPAFTSLMVKLVCVSNPHSSHNDRVMQALQDRNPAMPESYIEEILDENGSFFYYG